MTCDVYSVTLLENGWALLLNELVLASGMDQERAQRAAAVGARLSATRGRTALVLSKNDIGGPSSLRGGYEALRNSVVSYGSAETDPDADELSG